MVSSIQLASAAVRLTLSVVTAAAQHYTKRQHDEHENNEINRLDMLGNLGTVMPPTSLVVARLGTAGGSTTLPAEATIICGPHTRHGWEGNADSSNTDASFDTCVSQGNSQDAQQPAGSWNGH